MGFIEENNMLKLFNDVQQYIWKFRPKQLTEEIITYLELSTSSVNV